MFISSLFLFDQCLGYIDPNSGGWLFQLLFPIFITIVGVWTLLRKKMEALHKRWLDRKDKKRHESK